MHKVTILLCKTPTHFSARSSLNYEILSEMFFKCVPHRVKVIQNLCSEVLLDILKVTTLFIFDSDNDNVI